MSRLIVGLTVLAALAGASTTAAPVPVHLMPKEPPLYFPTRVGAKWVYQYGEEGRHGVFGEILLTLSVTAVERTDRGVFVTVTRHEPNGESFLDQKVLVTREGLEYVAGDQGEPVSPRCVLKIPCVVGEKWKSDRSTEDFVRKWEYTALGTEEVKVPAGKFTAVGVRTRCVSGRRGDWPLIGSSADDWYAPGVGVVRVQYNPCFTPSSLLLKSFTP